MAFPKLALLLALAAVGANAADDDQVVVGQTFMAGAIDPTSGSTGWALTSHGISEKLFTVDKDGNIVGQVAESVERVSDNVWEVTLNNHHDGHCCEYKCVGSKDSCKALPGGKVESSAGGHAYEDSDGALGRKALAATATVVLAGLAF